VPTVDLSLRRYYENWALEKGKKASALISVVRKRSIDYVRPYNSQSLIRAVAKAKNRIRFKPGITWLPFFAFLNIAAS